MKTESPTDTAILNGMVFATDALLDTEYEGQTAFGDNHWACNYGSHQEAIAGLAHLLAEHSQLRARRLLDPTDADIRKVDAVTWVTPNNETLAEPGTQAAIDMIMDRLKTLIEAPARYLAAYRIEEADGQDPDACKEAASDAVWNTHSGVDDMLK